MKAHALLVANNAEFSHWLVKALGNTVDLHLERPGQRKLSVSDQGGPAAKLAFVEIESDRPEVGAQMIDELLEGAPATPVFAVGDDASSDAVLCAMRAGARDFFVLDRDTESLAGRVRKTLLRHSEVGGAVQPGRLIPLVSAKSTPRLAFVGGHLGLADLELRGSAERVLLIDAAAPTGASLVYFNINQTYTLGDALEDVYRCDQTLVETAFARHPSGLFVLAFSEDELGYPAVNAQDLLTLVETLRGFFSAVYITLDGHCPMPALSGILSQATHPLLISDQTVFRSRTNKHLLRLLLMQDVPLDRAGLVVDGYHKRGGLEPDALAELMKLPLLGRLGGSVVAREQAANAGESMLTTAPRDEFVTGIRALAARLLEAGDGAVKTPAEEGLFSRLFG